MSLLCYTGCDVHHDSLPITRQTELSPTRGPSNELQLGCFGRGVDIPVVAGRVSKGNVLNGANGTDPLISLTTDDVCVGTRENDAHEKNRTHQHLAGGVSRAPKVRVYWHTRCCVEIKPLDRNGRHGTIAPWKM